MGRLVVTHGLVEIETVSLFPVETWKGRKNGLRKDLVQLLANLKPGFVRFHGECIVEGRELTNRYQWKKTVGETEDRELIMKNKELTAWNSFSNPGNIAVVNQKIKVSGRSLMLTLDGNSVNVLRIKL